MKISIFTHVNVFRLFLSLCKVSHGSIIPVCHICSCTYYIYFCSPSCFSPLLLSPSPLLFNSCYDFPSPLSLNTHMHAHAHTHTHQCFMFKVSDCSCSLSLVQITQLVTNLSVALVKNYRSCHKTTLNVASTSLVYNMTMAAFMKRLGTFLTLIRRLIVKITRIFRRAIYRSLGVFKRETLIYTDIHIYILYIFLNYSQSSGQW